VGDYTVILDNMPGGRGLVDHVGELEEVLIGAEWSTVCGASGEVIVYTSWEPESYLNFALCVGAWQEIREGGSN
jgi:hypothetical protein